MPAKSVIPAYLRAVVRWGDWYDSKLSFFFITAFYCALRRPSPGADEIADMLWLLPMFAAYGAFGHVINDYSDREVDRAAGKRRLISGWNSAAVTGFLAAAILGGLSVAGLRFSGGTLALTALAFLVAAVYSVPPLRLKERGILGVVAAAMAQRSIPMAVIFEAFGVWDWGSILLCLMGLLVGLRFIIVHQLEDRRNDLRTGIRTVATRLGAQRLSRIARRILIPIETATAVAAVIATSTAAPAAGIVAAAYGGCVWATLRRGRQLPVLSVWLFEFFYSLLWPLALGATLAMRSPLFIGMLMIAVVFQHRRIEMLIQRPALLTQAPKRTLQTHYRKSDPHPHYAVLRSLAPVHVFQSRHLGTVWLVLRHSDALTVLKDRRFSGNPAAMHAQEDGTTSRRNPLRGFGPDLLEMDPPEHTRLRGLVSRAFTSRQIERLEPRVQQLANDLLDRHLPAGEFELMSAYASVIPVTIISEILGIPIGNKARFRAFTFALTTGYARSPRLQKDREEFTDFLKKLFDERRRRPRDDVVSAMVHGGDNGDRMSPEELLGMTVLLLIAGHITTVNLIGNGILALLRHPEQLELLRQQPALMENAVEELLRFDGPLELTPAHFPNEDVSLEDIVIPRGSSVRVAVASANRDEDVFPNPDALDITRDARNHLAFGQGVHYCLGAPLARMEGRIALRTLIERCPNLRLTDQPPSWITHPAMRGLSRLRLRF